MAYIERKKNGSVKIIVSAGYDSAGKQIRPSKTIEAAELAGLTHRQQEKEIERQKVLFEQKIQNGTHLDGEKITFGEFVGKWLVDYAEKQFAQKTLFESKKLLELRILPAIGHIKLAKLNPAQLLSFYNNLSENGMRLDYKYTIKNETKDILLLPEVKECVEARTIRRLMDGESTNVKTAERISQALNLPISKLFSPVDGQKGLSAKTISNYHSLISSILSSAVQWQIIFSNPCERVKPPKKQKKEARHYDDEQIISLLSLLESEPLQYKVFIFLAVFTGARLGELSALSWNDINFEERTLKIAKSLQYLPEIGVFEKSPKTESSNRLIYLSDSITELLKTHKKSQLLERIKCGDKWQDFNKVFTKWNGVPVLPNTISGWFHKFITKNKLPYLAFHQLRHTNASLLIADGLDVVTLSKRLGHSQTSTTVNIYSHALQKANREASNKIDAILSGNKNREKTKINPQ
jgi:integrase